MVAAECGVPLAHYVNSDNGRRVAAGCADLRGVSVLTFACIFALFIALQSLFIRVPIDHSAAATTNSSSSNASGTTAKPSASASASATGRTSKKSSKKTSKIRPRSHSSPHGGSVQAEKETNTETEVAIQTATESDTAGGSEGTLGTEVELDASVVRVTQAQTKPLVPALWALLPLSLGVAYYFSASTFATSNFNVKLAAFESSELSKTDFVQMEAADRRIQNTVGTSVFNAGLVTAGGVLGRLVR